MAGSRAPPSRQQARMSQSPAPAIVGGPRRDRHQRRGGAEAAAHQVERRFERFGAEHGLVNAVDQFADVVLAKPGNRVGRHALPPARPSR
jgi:hypothetical protein